MKRQVWNEDTETTAELLPTEIKESQLSGAAYEVQKNKKEKKLGSKIKERIKNRVKRYIKNLDPRGKDKYWWTGNLFNMVTSGILYAVAPEAVHIKSLVSAGVSVGVYALERGIEKYYEKRLTEEENAERIAKRQEKFPNGTSRIRRFLLGVAAGSIYGAALGELFHVGGLDPAVNHQVKNIGRRLDVVRQK
jgi:hypothetical protein